jgi:hypothetical protein
VVFTLSPREQGTYYLFLSLLALKAFFDLGASAAIAQMTPHLKAPPDENGATRRIDPEFVFVATRLIRLIATVFGIVCGVVGVAYLIWTGESQPHILVMWICTVAVTALGGSIEGHTQIVYGLGNVDEVSKMRLVGVFIQYPVQWILLLAGASLFSFVASILAVFLWQLSFLRRRHPYVWEKSRPPCARQSEIRAELAALVKRASLTYVSGFLVFQVQQPIIFKYLGPEESARLGFTNMIGATLIGLAAMWSVTSFPRYASKVADGRIEDGFADFKRTWSRTIVIATLGMGAALTAILIFKQFPRFDERLMSLSAALPLFAAIWMQQTASAATFWPRSFKKEPFAVIALTQMVVTPLAVFLCVRSFGLLGVGLGNTVSWMVGATGIIWISKSYFPKRNTAIAAVN